MKPLLIALLLVGSCCAQDVKPAPCLAVYPQTANRSIDGAAPVAMPFILAHGERFLYLESSGLGVGDVKAKYKKSELKKLEARGVRIVVTTKPAGCAAQ